MQIFTCWRKWREQFLCRTRTLWLMFLVVLTVLTRCVDGVYSEAAAHRLGDILQCAEWSVWWHHQWVLCCCSVCGSHFSPVMSSPLDRFYFWSFYMEMWKDLIELQNFHLIKIIPLSYSANSLIIISICIYICRCACKIVYFIVKFCQIAWTSFDMKLKLSFCIITILKDFLLFSLSSFIV